MNKLKTLAFTGFVTLAVFSMIAYTSCSKDKCEGVICSNGGACDSNTGTCNCALGYEGNTCENKSVTKFGGIYSAVDNCPLGSRTGNELKYSVSLLPVNSDATKMSIIGIGGSDVSVTATVSKDGKKLDINEQTLNGKTYSGDVEYKTNGVLVMGFKVSEDNIPLEACTATLTKQ